MKKKLIIAALLGSLVLYALIGSHIHLNVAAVQTLAALGMLIGMVSGDWKKVL